jgi:hypothetical protein
MIQWIRNRIWNRRRLIFRYHDGVRTRRADPIELAAGLHAHDAYLHSHLSEAVDGDRDAIDIVARTACDVFGVHPLAVDGKSGMTVAERVELMLAFDLYLIELKKNIDPSPTQRIFTESTSVKSPEPAMNNTSDSGSTVDDPPSEPPNASDSAS